MLSEIIKQARIKKGFSLYRLSQVAKCPVATLRGIENGRNNNPSFKTICKLAFTLDISIEKLYKVVIENEQRWI